MNNRELEDFEEWHDKIKKHINYDRESGAFTVKSPYLCHKIGDVLGFANGSGHLKMEIAMEDEKINTAKAQDAELIAELVEALEWIVELRRDAADREIALEALAKLKERV